jgi:putative glutathione S-transferase
MLDRRRVVGHFRQDGEGKVGHLLLPITICIGRGPSPCRCGVSPPTLTATALEMSMGLLVEGVWRDDSFDKARMQDGRFVRPTTKFRNWITPDGSPGPSGEGGFPAETGRYHLYVSLACPWAHRTIIFRHLKRLENVISMSVTSWHMAENGWTFDTKEGSSGDPVNHAQKLSEIYLLADPRYTGRVTVPVVWDKTRKTIVSNESSEIIRMLNSAFDALTNESTDYYPPELRSEIDAVNELVYPNVNNGVYRAGFAATQAAYEEAFRSVFATLDELERRLSRQRYVAGPRLTEADWRLFSTLIRFDAVYYSHFKCNLRRIGDYANLSNYLRDLYQVPGVDETVSIDHIKRHYYMSQRKVNPTGIVPLGPELHFTAPHDRDRFVS